MFDVRWNMPLRANWVRDNILGVETWNTLFAGVSCMVRWRHDVILPQFQMVEPGVRWTKPENFGKTSPTEKTHLPKRDDVFFFFLGFSGKSSGPPIPKSSMFSGTETSPRFRGEQVGRDESGGRWNEGVGSERAPVSCWLFMVGRLDELMAYKKPLVILK